MQQNKLLIIPMMFALICAIAFSQTPVRAKLSVSEIKAAAHESNDRCLSLLAALGKELPPGTGKGEYEIPPICWSDPIKELKPVKVYNHAFNIAIVLSIRDGVEEGIYVYNVISSYAPITNVKGAKDGFEFARDLVEPDLYIYKRTIRGEGVEAK